MLVAQQNGFVVDIVFERYDFSKCCIHKSRHAAAMRHVCQIPLTFPITMRLPCLTGQFAQSLPGSGQVPGGFYWSGGYWGYCPPPSPPAINPPPPPPPGATTSFIKSPQSGQSFETGPNGFAAVLLDATGSIPAPNRRIVSMAGAVKSSLKAAGCILVPCPVTIPFVRLSVG